DFAKELEDSVSQALKEANLEKEVSIRTDGSGVSIIFSSTLFFYTLSAEGKVQSQLILSRPLEAISFRPGTEPKKFRLVIEGHTDNRPVMGGTFPSNWELSSARAARVLRMFLDRRFLPDHLVAIGYADTHPEVKNEDPSHPLTDEQHAKNRRVVL